MEKDALRKKVIEVLKEQGFEVNPHIKPSEDSKEVYKQLQKNGRIEQISIHKRFLQSNIDLVKKHCRDGKDISLDAISLELREVKSGSFEENIFRWWNLIWWSIPYQRSYGRQLRFLIWDVTHDSPFGLICLQSPVLKMSVRDNYLKLPKDELDIWVNRSMNAQRVGALPPYNELLGGKLVAITLTSNEIREIYKEKYKNYISVLRGRKLKSDLLFITTTSAFGRSSLYNRLKFNDEIVAESLGYTKGFGTFHISEKLYEEILDYLSSLGVNIARGYGNGPSRKLRLLSLGLSRLGLSSYECHGIKREFYLFPLVKNLNEVIQCDQEPIWFDRPFTDIVDYWKKRWAEPRALRKPCWIDFKTDFFFDDVIKMLDVLEV